MSFIVSGGLSSGAVMHEAGLEDLKLGKQKAALFHMLVRWSLWTHNLKSKPGGALPNCFSADSLLYLGGRGLHSHPSSYLGKEWWGCIL